MALKLETTLPKNKVGNYWKILSVTSNFHDNESVVHIGLFRNQEVSELEDPIHVESILFKNENNPFSLKELSKARSNPKSIGYNALKIISYPFDFSIAEDI